MPRLCSDRSRSYPGRPVREAVQLTLDSFLHGNMQENRAGVSRGHSSSTLRNEGPNPENGRGPISSTTASNPTGGAADRRVIDQPDPDANLLERILSRPNMLKAWERVKANKGAPGIDNMPIDDFMAYAREHWDAISDSLLAGTYQPLPVKRVEIPKATGGTRPLGIPTVLDRLIQQAIAQVLQPIFDPYFSESSFGFRPFGPRCGVPGPRLHPQGISRGRGCRSVEIFRHRGPRRPDVPGRQEGPRQAGPRAGRQIPAGRGGDRRSQGGPLSPLLANILLDDLDKELEKRGTSFRPLRR